MNNTDLASSLQFALALYPLVELCDLLFLSIEPWSQSRQTTGLAERFVDIFCPYYFDNKVQTPKDFARHLFSTVVFLNHITGGTLLLLCKLDL